MSMTDMNSPDRHSDIEASIQSCYSTWGTSYFDEYYTEKAPYPPVHRDLIVNIICQNTQPITTLLDVGCGPASMLRAFAGKSIDLYGFDLTPEMVAEGDRVMVELGLPRGRIWQGSVLDPQAFVYPDRPEVNQFDAAICIGVLPHIPPETDATVFQNLYGAVKSGGMAIVEARNQLFSLFTLNRYSYDFFAESLIQVDQLPSIQPLDQALDTLKKQFRMDLPPIREGKADEPGYDQVLSRTHNPLTLKEQFAAVGFTDVQVLFYHFHCLPPMLEREMPEFFRQQSLAMENPTDWRGYFMASAFLLVGQKP